MSKTNNKESKKTLKWEVLTPENIDSFQKDLDTDRIEITEELVSSIVSEKDIIAFKMILPKIPKNLEYLNTIGEQETLGEDKTCTKLYIFQHTINKANFLKLLEFIKFYNFSQSDICEILNHCEEINYNSAKELLWLSTDEIDNNPFILYLKKNKNIIPDFLKGEIREFVISNGYLKLFLYLVENNVLKFTTNEINNFVSTLSVKEYELLKAPLFENYAFKVNSETIDHAISNKNIEFLLKHLRSSHLKTDSRVKQILQLGSPQLNEYVYKTRVDFYNFWEIISKGDLKTLKGALSGKAKGHNGKSGTIKIVIENNLMSRVEYYPYSFAIKIGMLPLISATDEMRNFIWENSTKSGDFYGYTGELKLEYHILESFMSKDSSKAIEFLKTKVNEKADYIVYSILSRSVARLLLETKNNDIKNFIVKNFAKEEYITRGDSYFYEEMILKDSFSESDPEDQLVIMAEYLDRNESQDIKILVNKLAKTDLKEINLNRILRNLKERKIELIVESSEYPFFENLCEDLYEDWYNLYSSSGDLNPLIKIVNEKTHVFQKIVDHMFKEGRQCRHMTKILESLCVLKDNLSEEAFLLIKKYLPEDDETVSKSAKKDRSDFGVYYDLKRFLEEGEYYEVFDSKIVFNLTENDFKKIQKIHGKKIGLKWHDEKVISSVKDFNREFEIVDFVSDELLPEIRIIPYFISTNSPLEYSIDINTIHFLDKKYETVSSLISSSVGKNLKDELIYSKLRNTNYNPSEDDIISIYNYSKEIYRKELKENLYTRDNIDFFIKNPQYLGVDYIDFIDPLEEKISIDIEALSNSSNINEFGNDILSTQLTNREVLAIVGAKEFPVSIDDLAGKILVSENEKDKMRWIDLFKKINSINNNDINLDDFKIIENREDSDDGDENSSEAVFIIKTPMEKINNNIIGLVRSKLRELNTDPFTGLLAFGKIFRPDDFKIKKTVLKDGNIRYDYNFPIEKIFLKNNGIIFDRDLLRYVKINQEALFEMFETLFKEYSTERLLNSMTDMTTWLIRDTFNAYSRLFLNMTDEIAKERFKKDNSKELKLYLIKECQKKKNFEQVHDFLSDMTQYLSKDNLDFSEEQSSLNGLEGRVLSGGYKVNIPKETVDLINIGSNLNICVGRSDYDEKIKKGQSVIIYLESKKEGICVEFSNRQNRLVLSQAKTTRNTDRSDLECIRELLDLVNEAYAA